MHKGTRSQLASGTKCWPMYVGILLLSCTAVELLAERYRKGDGI